MESSIHQMYWGSQTESEAARTLQEKDPFKVLSERIQQALSTQYTEPLVRAMRVTREERVVDGLLCDGYCITVEVSVGQRRISPSEARAMECQMESLLSVALLDLLCPVHVDFVAMLPAPDTSAEDA